MYFSKDKLRGINTNIKTYNFIKITMYQSFALKKNYDNNSNNNK